MKNFPVTYKPKFCCECGEKIERVSWNLLTSRKFCEDCDGEFGAHDRWRIGVGAGAVLLFGIFAATLTLNFLQPKQTAIVQTKQVAPAVSPAANGANTNPQNAPQTNAVGAQTLHLNLQQNAAAQQQTAAQTPKTLAANPNQIAPIVEQQIADNPYYCGARTQKGTPCTRRVRGGGRCWQHAGKPPMLAQEKLLIR